MSPELPSTVEFKTQLQRNRVSYSMYPRATVPLCERLDSHQIYTQVLLLQVRKNIPAATDQCFVEFFDTENVGGTKLRGELLQHTT